MILDSIEEIRFKSDKLKESKLWVILVVQALRNGDRNHIGEF